MKKVLYFFAIAALAFVSACQREDLPEMETYDGTITFISAKPVLEEETPTKTEWTGETIQWSAGDQIRMAYTVAGVWQGASDSNTAPKLYASNHLDEATDVAEFTVNASFTSTATGTHVFYGLYPSSLVGTSFDDAPVAAINIPTEQEPAADSFDGAADVMIGVSEELAEKPSSEETVLMSWTRLVAHADLTIKNLTINEGETIDNVTLTAQEGADLVGMHSLNLVTGEFSNAQGATNEIVIKANNLTYANKTIKVWASMLPATLTELTVTVETDKAYYVRSFSGFTREFKQNMHNTMNIGMTSAVRTEKTANLEDYEESFNNSLGGFSIDNKVLSEGLTYVWAKNSGYAKASAYKSGQAYAATSYLISPALTIGSDKSKLTFEHAANYLNGNAFDNNFYVVVLEGESEEVLTLDVKPDGSSWNFVTSTVSLSKYKGKSIKIGFKYTSTNQLAGTWEVRNFKVTDVQGAEPATEYTITVNPSENGTVTASAEKAVEGTEISLTVAPESGYALDELTVVDAENSPVTITDDYKFIMPASNVTVSATFEELTGTVNDFTWDLTKASYASASAEQVKWENANVTMTADKASASTAANNYLPTSQSSTRFYKSSTLSFTPATGVTITKVEYTATTEGYATALATSSWANASATVADKLVTIIPTDGSNVFYATIGATTGASAVKVYYIGGSAIVETEYSITISETSNGTVTASAATATKGTEITLTITPSAGYELETLSVADSNNNPVSVSNNKFIMPESSVTVSATFAPITATVSWTRVSDVTTLLAGGTFIIGYESTANSGIIIPMANSGSATISSAGFLYSGADATSGGTGTINMATVSSTSAFEVTIEASTLVNNAINIKLGDYYLGNTNTKNNCKLFEEASANTAFTPTISTNGVFTLKIEANTGKDTNYQYLKYNIGSPRFAVYSTTPENIVIYKKN